MVFVLAGCFALLGVASHFLSPQAIEPDQAHAKLYDTKLHHKRFTADPDPQEERSPLEDQGAVVLVREQSLAEVIRIAATYNDVEFNLLGAVEGKVINRRLPMDMEPMLVSLAEDFDLAWAFYGDILFVSKRSVKSVQRYRINQIGIGTIQAAARKGCDLPDSYKVKSNGQTRSIILTSHASYVACLETFSSNEN